MVDLLNTRTITLMAMLFLAKVTIIAQPTADNPPGKLSHDFKKDSVGCLGLRCAHSLKEMSVIFIGRPATDLSTQLGAPNNSWKKGMRLLYTIESVHCGTKRRDKRSYGFYINKKGIIYRVKIYRTERIL